MHAKRAIGDRRTERHMRRGNEQHSASITSHTSFPADVVRRSERVSHTQRASAHPNFPALCWFGATCLAMAAFVLVFVGIEQGVSKGSLATEPWLVGVAAAALVIMGVLIPTAFALESR